VRKPLVARRDAVRRPLRRNLLTRRRSVVAAVHSQLGGRLRLMTRRGGIGDVRGRLIRKLQLMTRRSPIDAVRLDLTLKPRLTCRRRGVDDVRPKLLGTLQLTRRRGASDDVCPKSMRHFKVTNRRGPIAGVRGQFLPNLWLTRCRRVRRELLRRVPVNAPRGRVEAQPLQLRGRSPRTPTPLRQRRGAADVRWVRRMPRAWLPTPPGRRTAMPSLAASQVVRVPPLPRMQRRRAEAPLERAAPPLTPPEARRGGRAAHGTARLTSATPEMAPMLGTPARATLAAIAET
jgi:hypothetical protein